MSDEATRRAAEEHHRAYEELAPTFGYETRAATRIPWDELPNTMRGLMLAAEDRALAASGLREENERLRAALAYEARVVEAHYEGYKSFPKSRRKHAEEQVQRMRSAALGNEQREYAGVGFFTRNLEALRRFGLPSSPVSEETAP